MRKSLLFIAAALMLSVSAFAQWDNGGQGFQRPDEATMIKMRTDRMVKELGLNETQAEKLLELNQKYPTAMMGGPGMRGPRMNGRRDGQEVNQDEANQETTGKKAKKAKKNKKAEAQTQVEPQEGGRPEMPPGMDEDKMKEMKNAREAYENELKGILTDEQFNTWKENSNRRPQGRGPGGPGGFGPGGPGGGPGRGGFGNANGGEW